VTLNQPIGTRIPEANNLFSYLRAKFSAPFIPGCRDRHGYWSSSPRNLRSGGT
jgi:hypothetical protein